MESNQNVQGLMSLNLKLIRGTEMRKVVDPPKDITALQELISSLFGVDEYFIRYVDEEGDTITISTDNELMLAYHDAHRLGLMSFKFYIEHKDLSDAKSEAARQLEILAASVAALSKKLNESQMTEQSLQPVPANPQLKAPMEPKLLRPWRPMKIKKFIKSLVRREADSLLGHVHHPNEHYHDLEWSGVTCDNCGICPIKGLRYKCAVCDNFDFCENCEQTTKHLHPFIKLKSPTHPTFHVKADITRRDFKNFKKIFTGKKPKARFVDHVNFKESDSVSAGLTIHKIWKVKNVGASPWPVATKLVFCKGELCGEATEVPPLAPGEEADVGAILMIPEQAGRYYAVWRLASPCGQRFGDKLHILVNAEIPEDLSEAFMDKLKIIEGMGFEDHEHNRRVLEAAGGDVNLAITRLISS